MKKRVVCLILFSLLAVLFTRGASAALGLSPALVEMNFQPDLSFSVNFKVVGAATTQNLEVYATGDLSQYVSFDKTAIMGGDSFVATVTLPKNVEKPGKNRLFIGVREVQEAKQGIGTRLAVEALIAVYVPYPGRYAEVAFAANDANEGEPVVFSVDVSNLGKEQINAGVQVEVSQGGKSVETLQLGAKTIEVQTKEHFEAISKYSPGIYFAEATTDYGNVVKTNVTFKVGTLLINVTNWTSYVYQGKINKFDIDVESLWNSKVKNIYAGVNVTKDGKFVEYFETSPVSLDAWAKAKLNGYFDAENTELGEYKADITLFYEDKTSGKTVYVKVIKKSNLMIYIIMALVVLVIIAGGVLFWKHEKKKNNKKAGKNK